MFKSLYLVAILLGLGVDAAQAAAAAPWVDKKPVRYRLVTAEVAGQAYVALQLQLKPGWHTYWRYPGASGIAPEFRFNASRGGKIGAAIFPAPHFFDDGVGGFYGYEGETGFVFPMQAKPGTMVKLESLLGVCREVCIPFEIRQTLVLPTNGGSNPQHKQVIANLLAAQATPENAALRVARVSFDGVSLQVVVTGQDLKTPYVMSVPGPHDILGPPRTAARHPAAHLIEIPAWSKLDHPLIGRKLTFLVRDGTKAIEQEVEITDHRLLPNVHPHTD
ncbi:MAG: hypothetical protein HOM48_08790 [Rhodobiaceae bacterium]|jgi:DsbC/DsbD-like thiol-disulfide interchange protein|nr:hypothetical protein [Rhodobiaceae bacterium]